MRLVAFAVVLLAAFATLCAAAPRASPAYKNSVNKRNQPSKRATSVNLRVTATDTRKYASVTVSYTGKPLITPAKISAASPLSPHYAVLGSMLALTTAATVLFFI